MNLSSFLLKENGSAHDIGREIRFGDPLGIWMNSSFYLIAFVEGICTLLLIFGLFSRVTALILIFNFLVILWVHPGDEFKILELRFFYLASYTALALLGPGRISLDYLLFNPNKKLSVLNQ